MQRGSPSGTNGWHDGAARLANTERSDAFVVAQPQKSGHLEEFDSLDRVRWSTPDKTLGRGPLKAENVTVRDGILRIELPAGTLEGGEMESADSYGYGSYAARIKAVRAPSSITGSFLYNPPDFHTEIDVEIFNDGSRRISFTTYADGEQTNTVRKKLPFDPTAAFHEYRIDL
jgi:endo-1,3-1,4-beta-glycanase ExoK